MKTGIVYSNYDNAPVLVFTDEDGEYDLSAAQKIELHIASQSYDTIENSDVFDVSELATGRLGLKLGTLELDDGDYPIRVVVFGTGYPNGYVWCHEDDVQTTRVRVKS